MPRTKSRSSNAASSSRKSRSSRSGTKASRSTDSKVRRYLDFIRAILGSSPRNGR